MTTLVNLRFGRSICVGVGLTIRLSEKLIICGTEVDDQCIRYSKPVKNVHVNKVVSHCCKLRHRKDSKRDFSETYRNVGTCSNLKSVRLLQQLVL